MSGSAKISDILGLDVKNYQNERLGKVEDITMDLESGRIVQLILGVNDAAGSGGTHTAVPPGSFRHYVAQKSLYLDVSAQKLGNAPKFEMSQWAENSDSEHLSVIHRYYGVESPVGVISTNSVPNPILPETSDVINRQNQLSDIRQPSISSIRPGQLQKASQIIGISVKGSGDEKLGEVQNIMVNLAAGRIVAVIVSSPGPDGTGTEISAISPSSLRFSNQGTVIQLDVSREILSKSSHLKGNEWSGPVKSASTNINWNASSATSLFVSPEQGESQADVQTTAQIRREITAEANLSQHAKNVKIVSNGGRVFLLGAVDTTEEKRVIGDIANRVIRSENVENRLEVKLTPTGRSQDGK